MKAQTRTKLALFGGTAALVIAVGGAGIATASSTITAASPTSPQATATQAPPAPAASTARADAGQPASGGVHIAQLTGYIFWPHHQ
jgi:hypothetical protein